ncbi:MAG: PEGA domain-containing protein [Bacteroidetes bacterium]|nr:PEGA domain-containing protein [Bacteroidota bacterium]
MKTLLFLSLLFLPTLLLSQTLREFDLLEMSEQQIPVFIDHPNEGAIVFYTAISGFTIESSTAGVVSTQSDGSKYSAFLKPERQILTLKAPGFMEKKLSIDNLSAKQAKFYRVNPKEEKYSSEKGSYQINSDPSGVLLTIEGYPGFKEFTPFELKDYEARKYKITLAKPGFYTLDTLIEIRTGIRQSSFYKIRSQFGLLSLKAPLNVSVKINNQSVEVGPDYVNQKLKDGVYTLVVNDSRFDPYHETVTVGSGETRLLELPLVKRVGVLQIDHSDAFEVSVNGTVYTKKAGIQLLEFFEGSYQAKIKRTGFASVEFSFVIQKGKIVSWTPVFKPILVQVKLTSEPEGASVVLIRNGEKKVLGFTPIEEQISAGEVEFLFSSDGFTDYKFKETVVEGKPLTRKINLSDLSAKNQPGISPKGVETVIDSDGNVYHTVKIGTQEWTVENLRTTKYNDGTPIAKITDQSTWANRTTEAYCAYDNNENNVTKYGYLYNWYVVNTGKLAPETGGWRVPTDDDWDKLMTAVGGSSAEGTKLKSKTGWNRGGNGTDDYGFSALPGGGRGYNGGFSNVGYYGNWWSSKPDDTYYSWNRGINFDDSEVSRGTGNNRDGFSVRLVRDIQ